MASGSGRITIHNEKNTIIKAVNICERYAHQDREIMVRSGIILNRCTELKIFTSTAMNADIHINEIRKPYFQLLLVQRIINSS